MNSSNSVHKLEHVFTITDYSFYSTKKKDINSLVFSAPTGSEYKWHLKIKFSYVDNFGVHLFVDCIGRSGMIFAKFKFGILDDQHELKHSRHCTGIRNFQLGVNRSWGWNKYLSNHELQNYVLPTDKLMVYCAIIFSEEDYFTDDFNQTISAQIQSDGIDFILSENFESLFTNQDYSDVVVSVNSKEFQVHKNILAARSPVFDRMFKSDMTESEKNRIEITDMDAKVVEQMLRFIYTGKCDNSSELMEGLFVAADKYDLKGLKSRSEKILHKNLSLKNATKVLILADMHGAQKLKSHAISFIVSNSKEMVKMPDWKNMVESHPELLNEIFIASLS